MIESRDRHINGMENTPPTPLAKLKVTQIHNPVSVCLMSLD